MVAVKEMEDTLGELPGLEGTRFVSRSVEDAGRRLGQTGRRLSATQSRGRTLVPSAVSITSRPHRLERVPEIDPTARSPSPRAPRPARPPAPGLLARLPPLAGVALQVEAQDLDPRDQQRTLLAGRTSAERSRSFTTRTAVGMSRSFDTASRNRASNSVASGPSGSPVRPTPRRGAAAASPVVGRLHRLPREVHLRAIARLEREPPERQGSSPRSTSSGRGSRCRSTSRSSGL